VVRIYCNHSTCEAFQFIFEDFFTSVQKATGHKLKFKVFDPSGNIMFIHFDMEAAQVQGFATTLQQINDSAVSGIEECNLDVLVQYVKLCFVHFECQVFSICPHTGTSPDQTSGNSGCDQSSGTQVKLVEVRLTIVLITIVQLFIVHIFYC
jgi:hypothetical protein